MVLLAVLSVQLGSSVAKQLFAQLGTPGTTFLRVAFAAIVLQVVWRPGLRRYGVRSLAVAALFGLAVAGMNFCFYAALDRIPLGIAVTLEFVGPLGIAVAGSRRRLDALWIALAAAGVVLLTPWGGLHLNALGVFCALLAGSLWAAYIMLSARVGRAFSGGRGLAIAMSVGGLALLPFGVASAGANLLQPGLLLGGLSVALLSAVIPYSLELEALRSIPTRVFGILMSLEPAVGALVGYVVLRQTLDTRALIAIALVTLASAGATRRGAMNAIQT